MQWRFYMFFSIFLASLITVSCDANRDKTGFSDTPSADYILTAERILWDYPDSARQLLEKVNPDSISSYEAARRNLCLEHARLKTSHKASTDTLSLVLDYFNSVHDKRHAGEAAYVLGAAYERERDNYSATRALKQAETLLFSYNGKDSIPPVLLGMVCYKLGMNFESDWLYKEANECYKRALPYFEHTGYHLYIACTLRDIARTTKAPNTATQIRDSLFAKALMEARLTSDTTVYLDILDYAVSLGSVRDTAALLAISRYMTNVLRQPRYAGEMADYYISRGELDSAHLALDLFAQDTAAMSWSRDRWQYLQSNLLLMEGNADEAYDILDNLYQNRQRALVRDGQAKTYAIARQYDVLREKEKNLRLTVQQQRLYIALALSLAAVVILLLLWLLHRQRNKRREAEQQTHIQLLAAELAARREALRRALTERVELTRRMQMSEVLQGHKREELPIWAQQFIEQNLITSNAQWNTFIDEFNQASDNALIRLKADYPDLTKTDLLISALILTGLSIQDICVLLNQTKNTVWSRRLRIKTHIGLSEDDNLDDWLRARLNA